MEMFTKNIKGKRGGGGRLDQERKKLMTSGTYGKDKGQGNKAPRESWTEGITGKRKHCMNGSRKIDEGSEERKLILIKRKGSQ